MEYNIPKILEYKKKLLKIYMSDDYDKADIIWKSINHLKTKNKPNDVLYFCEAVKKGKIYYLINILIFI